jgi:5-methylcytosine-specific restriction endonuclease McrA
VASSKYTAKTLAPIVASSRTVADVLRKLGLNPTGGNYRHINARIRLAELDTAHFTRSADDARIAALTRDDLEPLVRNSKSVAQVLAQLGLPEDGRPHRRLTQHLRDLELDTTHFRGRGWSRGETRETHPILARRSRKARRPDHEVFIENSPEFRGSAIARRLCDLGTPYQCQICGICEWQGKPLVLHLDHINGINNDNRRANLRLLCPNCHSQTATYCRRPSRASECVLYDWSPRAWWNW